MIKIIRIIEVKIKKYYQIKTIQVKGKNLMDCVKIIDTIQVK